MTQQWKRLNNESSKAYAAFSIYRDLRIERSLEKVAEECRKSSRLIGRWSSKYHWVERATAYDDYLDERRRQKHEVQLGHIVDNITDKGETALEKTLEDMQYDNPSPFAKNERVTALINAIWKVHGLDKTKIEHSGEVKTTTNVTRLKEVIESTWSLEERIKFSEKLEELENGDS